jgi:nuclear cap-binding protein subunit 1
MSKHVSRLSAELAESRERLRRAESHSSDSDDEPEAGASSSAHKPGTSGDDKERPSEEMVERMEERLEAAQADQKNLFLIIFQVNIQILHGFLGQLALAIEDQE